MNECFTCGAKRNEFRYEVSDNAGGNTYYSCNTECLLDLAKSEREFSTDMDSEEKQR